MYSLISIIFISILFCVYLFYSKKHALTLLCIVGLIILKEQIETRLGESYGWIVVICVFIIAYLIHDFYLKRLKTGKTTNNQDDINR